MGDPTLTPTPDPTPTPTPDPTPVPTPPHPPADPGKQPPWGDPANFDAEKAWELIQTLKADKAEKGTINQRQEQELKALRESQKRLDAITKALGGDDDTPPDPAKLAEQITTEQSKTAEAEGRAISAERMVAVYRTALNGQHEGNPVGLLDSASFLRSMNDLDPNDEAAVIEAVNAAIAANPSLKATPPASPTPPFPGGPRTPVPSRAGSLGEAIQAKIATQRR